MGSTASQGPGWGPGPGLQGFRDSDQSLQAAAGDGFWEVQEPDRGGHPGEGVQDPEDFPGSRLGFGAQIFGALGLFAALC